MFLFFVLSAPGSLAAANGGRPVALVTAESLNQLLAVELSSGRILRRLRLPADPENVVADGSLAAVVSARAGAVTLLAPNSLRIRRVLYGFGSPHLAAFSPDRKHLYVTDDARGQLSVVDLARARVTRRIFVGYGAHHLSLSPDGNQAWVALGERAHTIVVLDTSRPALPRVVGRIRIRWGAHDLAFTPDGRRVWVTSDTSRRVSVFDAGTRRVLFSVGAGPPPQHVAFGRFAYVTSGYGDELRILSLDGALRRVIQTEHGSFNLATNGAIVVLSSLLDGSLTELTAPAGRLLLRERVAPAARDAALYVLP